MQRLLYLILSFTFSFIISAQDCYDLARKYYNSHQLDSARFYINRDLAKRHSADTYFLSGMIHEAEGKDLRALADYEAVIERKSNVLEAYFQKGIIYYNTASLSQAIADFSYVIKNYSAASTNAIYFAYDPYDVKGTFLTTIHSMMGRVYQYRGLANKKAGNYTEALQDFNKAFEFDTLAEFFINRSLLYSQLDKNTLAKKDLERAIELEPDNYLAWYNLAVIDESTRLPSELIENESFVPLLNLFGVNAYESGDYKSALAYFSKSIMHNSEDVLAYLNRGKSQLKLKNYKHARNDFIKALQIGPQAVELFYLIGNSFFYEQDFEKAISFYERYLDVDQGYSNVWYNAAMAYLSIQKNEEACRCLEQSVKLGMKQAKERIVKHCSNY